MKISITLVGLFELEKVLEDLSYTPGIKFAYAINKNKAAIQQLIVDAKKKYEPSEQYKAWDVRREELAKTFSQKNENGDSVIRVNEKGMREYIIPLGRKQSFEKELKTLEFAFATALKEQKTKAEAFKRESNIEKDIEVHSIKEEWLPDAITANQLEVIDPLIEGTLETIH